jgi:hypothetical protein
MGTFVTNMAAYIVDKVRRHSQDPKSHEKFRGALELLYVQNDIAGWRIAGGAGEHGG